LATECTTRANLLGRSDGSSSITREIEIKLKDIETLFGEIGEI